MKVLVERKFPVNVVRAFGSGKTSERWGAFGEEHLEEHLAVQALDATSLAGAEIVLMSAGEEARRCGAKEAIKAGALAIGNSSAWRMEKSCPLVVPEVNGADLGWQRGIVANPNCCTIALVMALEPLRQQAGLKRVVVATYQSAS